MATFSHQAAKRSKVWSKRLIHSAFSAAEAKLASKLLRASDVGILRGQLKRLRRFQQVLVQVAAKVGRVIRN